MPATWTAAEHERFLRLCGLDGGNPNFPRIRSPQGPKQTRLFREMRCFDKVPTPGRYEGFSEWQSRCNYLCLAAHVTEAERLVANDIAQRAFLTTEARNALEEIWALCMKREREAAIVRR
jgi:hypothetical protein